MSQDLIKRLEALVDAVSIMKRDDERYQGEIPASTISRVYEAHSAIFKAKEAQDASPLAPEGGRG